MSFQTGTSENSHNLVEQLYGFLIAAGWTLVAELKGGGMHDYVFHSTGEKGLDDIYIRIAAGESDIQPNGDIQHPYSDGYTGFVNAFAYQYFPSTGASGADGYNEIGRYGPSLYIADQDEGNIYEYNVLKSTDSPVRRFVSDVGNTPIRPYVAAFDGKRYLYQERRASDSNDVIDKIDLHDNTRSYVEDSSLNPTSNTVVYAHTDREWLYHEVTDTNSGGYFHKYDINSNHWWTRTSGDGWNLADPPWFGLGSGGHYGVQAVGVRRHRDPGNYWLYNFRGADGAGQYNTWSQLNLENDLWTGYSTPNAPWSVSEIGGNYAGFAMVVTKEMSGYDYDRLYLWRGDQNNGFASIEIGNDGYVLGGASWTSHADTPFDQATGLHAVCVGGTILCTGTFDVNSGQALYRWDLPDTPTGAGVWNEAGGLWTPTFNEGPYLFHVHDHICSRAPVSEFQSNTYWFFADKDRVVIVIKNADGEYEYLYAGKFAAYANPISTVLSEDIAAGSSIIQVSDPTLFEENKKYMISDSTGNNGSYATSGITNYRKLVAPSEIFTVVSNDGSGALVVTKLNYPYKEGSRVGEDPMPVAVRGSQIETAFTFDTVSLVNDDGYSDPAWQYYKLTPTVSDSFANATDIEERSLGTFLYGIVLFSEGDSFTGKEVRGQLSGVYSCGTAISSEEDVAVGSKTYVAFDITNTGETQRIVVGPK